MKKENGAFKREKGVLPELLNYVKAHIKFGVLSFYWLPGLKNFMKNSPKG